MVASAASGQTLVVSQTFIITDPGFTVQKDVEVWDDGVADFAFFPDRRFKT